MLQEDDSRVICPLRLPPGGTSISLAYLQQRDQVGHFVLLG